jgi:uncharacterized protein YukE
LRAPRRDYNPMKDGCVITMAAKQLTPGEFKVDLGQFEDAIRTVTAQAGVIEARCQDITSLGQSVQSAWLTPAGLGFADLAQVCTRQSTALTALLTEMIQRMQAAYQTYVAAEQANFNNFQ